MGHMPCTSILLTRITSSILSRDGPGSVEEEREEKERREGKIVEGREEREKKRKKREVKREERGQC